MGNYDFDDNEFPLAYLITSRCYGTWLHGDDRLTVDRHGLNIYGTPRRAANAKLKGLMRQNMKEEPILLNENQRAVVKEAINEVCDYRRYDLKAINVRTNHAHAVVAAQSKPEPIVDALRATRLGDCARLVCLQLTSALGPVEEVVVTCGNLSMFREQSRYVLYGQGDIVPDFED